MLHKERSAAKSGVLEMQGGGASSMDMSKEGGAPSQGKSTAGEEGSVHGVQGGEPRCKDLRGLAGMKPLP